MRLDQVAEIQPLTNRDAVLRLHDGTPVRVSRTYIDALLSALHATRLIPPAWRGHQTPGGRNECTSRRASRDARPMHR